MIVPALLYLLMSGDTSQPKASARDLLTTNPLDPQIEKLVKTAIAANPSDPEAHYLYGQWAILNNQESVAVREETRAAALSPQNPVALMQAWTLVGMAEDKLDHELRARAAFVKARAANLKLPQPRAAPLYEFAKFEQKRGRGREAQSLVSQVLGLDPGSAPAHLLQAKLFEASRDGAHSIQEAEKALETARDPDIQRAAHAFLARAYFEAGNDSKAALHREWIEQHGSAR